MRSPTMLLAALTLGATLTACGTGDGDEPAAVCSSIDDLGASVSALGDVDVTSSGGLAELKEAFVEVREDLGAVRDDAGAEFSDELKTVDSAYDDLKTAIEGVATAPSLAALGAVKSALSGFGTGVDSLVDDVQATC